MDPVKVNAAHHYFWTSCSGLRLWQPNEHSLKLEWCPYMIEAMEDDYLSSLDPGKVENQLHGQG